MEQLNQKWNKIMEVFFEQPNKSFTIREIAKLTRIPTTTIQRHIIKLKKQELITKNNQANITQRFKNKKILFMLNKLEESGLIDFLEKKYMPKTIIIFGGVRKGEFNKDSDIDIFIESTEKKQVNLDKFEKKLKHKIQLFKYGNINLIHKDLFNNIINGIKLRGYIDLRQLRT